MGTLGTLKIGPAFAESTANWGLLLTRRFSVRMRLGTQTIPTSRFSPAFPVNCGAAFTGANWPNSAAQSACICPWMLTPKDRAVGRLSLSQFRVRFWLTARCKMLGFRAEPLSTKRKKSIFPNFRKVRIPKGWLCLVSYALPTGASGQAALYSNHRGCLSV